VEQAAKIRYLFSAFVRRAWWHSSDNGLSWLWRPWCWIVGYHRPHHCDVYFEFCWFCGKSLWSRKRDGTPNPFINGSEFVDRAPTTRRRRTPV